MKKQTLVYGIIGLLIGVVLTGAASAYAVNNNHNGMMRMLGIHANTNTNGVMNQDDMTMGEMSNLLKSKTGDYFDKTFIQQMIVHHQGAIDMALLAKSNAKHAEVKTLADNILTAQSKEIDMMQTWQIQWGYKTTPSIESSNNTMDMSH